MIGCILCLVGLTALCDLSGIGFLRSHAAYFRWSNSPPVLIGCVAAFRIAEYASIPDIPWINRLAAGTLGIYLLQENVFLQPLLWEDLLRSASFEESPLLAVHALGSTGLIFVLGSVTDGIYRRLARKTEPRLRTIAAQMRQWVKIFMETRQ